MNCFFHQAIADKGELIVLAPGVKEFGEDPRIDELIRKHGYRTTPEVCACVCVRACVHACVRACLPACVCTCVRVRALPWSSSSLFSLPSPLLSSSW
jgi:hypothetical protein